MRWREALTHFLLLFGQSKIESPMKPKNNPLIVSVFLSLVFIGSASAAEQVYQDSSPLNTWNTTDANWDAGVVWTNGNQAVFDGVGETVTVGSVSTAGLTIRASGYQLSGGTITSAGAISAEQSVGIQSNVALAAAQSWNVAANQTLTLSGTISGSAALTYGGTGDYLISGINSNSGNLTIDQAKVTVGTGATLLGNGLNWSARSVTIQNGGILVADNYSNGAGKLWGQVGDGTNNIQLLSGGVFQMTGAVMESSVNKGIAVMEGNTGHFRVATGMSSVWGGEYTGRDFGIQNSATLVFDGGGDFTTSREIRGGGNLVKDDAGTLKLTGVNSFGGSVTVNEGVLEVGVGTTGGYASAIGGGGNSVVVNSGGTLWFSTGSRTSGYHSGAVNVRGGTITFDTQDNSFGSGKTITFDTAAGTMNGSGQWRMRDTGTKLVVTGAASGSLISVADLTLTGTVAQNFVFEVADGAAASDLTISSAIGGYNGSESVTKTGAGTMTLTGVSSYAGATTVSEGRLIVDGNISTSSLTTVRSGASLGGGGNLGALTVEGGGAVALGVLPNTLATGNLDFQTNSILAIRLNGLNAGGAGGYDQINVTGSLSLAGLLSLTAGFTPADNDLFFILTQDSTDAVNGTFAGLGQGSSVFAGSQEFQISYTGDATSSTFMGAGNDVVLRAIPEPTTALLSALSLVVFFGRRKRIA